MFIQILYVVLIGKGSNKKLECIVIKTFLLQSDKDEDSIGKVIRRKKRQLAEKDSHHHSNHRKTSSEIFFEVKAVAKAKFMLRLEVKHGFLKYVIQ